MSYSDFWGSGTMSLSDFYRVWLETHLNLSLYVEIGYEDGGRWIRNLFNPPQTAADMVARLRKDHPVHQSVGRYSSMSPEDPLYPLIWIDIDVEDGPAAAFREATALVNELEKRYSCNPILVRTPSKGIHVWIPLKKLLRYSDYVAAITKLPLTPHTDAHIKDPRKMARLPYTFKVVGGERRYSYIIDRYGRPVKHSEFSWEQYEPLDPAILGLMKMVVETKIVTINTVSRSAGVLEAERQWIWDIVKTGLPDGRKRFIFMVLAPYLAVARQMDEESVLDVCRGFLEASCRNFNSCSKIYDSWIRGVIRSAKSCGFKGFGLEKLKEKDPQLYSTISDALKKVDGLNRNLIRAVAAGASSTVQKLIADLPEELTSFLRETGLREFSYEDFRKWLESRYGSLDASTWHHYERLLRKWAEEGYLGRKFLVDGQWMDYGSGKVDRPPSKEVRFYVRI